MSNETNVLILGNHGSSLSTLADRVRSMGFRAVRAKTPQDAIDLAQERGFRFSVALVQPELATFEVASAFDDLRHRTDSHDLVVLATGIRPSTEERERLRAGGVELAIWQPVTDHALQFQLNRAAGRDRTAALRENQRVPTDWTTRVMVAGRAKSASLYSLSGGGAYLATNRPSLRGAEMAIDLPLPSGVLSVLGKVIYTNVPGNLHRSHLPTGMGVRFVRTPGTDREAICQSVEQEAAHYFV